MKSNNKNTFTTLQALSGTEAFAKFRKVQKQKREPQSDSPSTIRKHVPQSIYIIYKNQRKNTREDNEFIEREDNEFIENF